MAKKYGALDPETWQEDLRLMFRECFRVLKPYGVLIFKWNEVQISLSKILKLCDEKPLFGNKQPILELCERGIRIRVQQPAR